MFLTDAPAANRVDANGSPRDKATSVGEGPEQGLIAEERCLLRQFEGLLERQSEEEPFLDARRHEDLEQLQVWFDTEYQEVIVQFARRKEELEKTLFTNRKRIKARYEHRLAEVEANLVAGRKALKDVYAREKETGKSEYKEARWTATAVYDGIEAQAEKSFRATSQELDEIQRRLEATRDSALEYLTNCQMPIPEESTPDEARLSLPELRVQSKDLAMRGKNLVRMSLPTFFRREGVLWLFLALWIVAAAVGYFAAGLVWGIVGGAAVAMIGAFAGSAYLYGWAKAKVSRVSVPLLADIARTIRAESTARQEVIKEHRTVLRDSRSKMEQDVQRAGAAYQARKGAAKDQRDRGWHTLVRETQQRRLALKRRRDRDWKRNETYFETESAANQQSYEAASKNLHDQHNTRHTELESHYSAARDEIRRNWDQGVGQVFEKSQALLDTAAQHSPAWEAPIWQKGSRPAAAPATLNLGTFQLTLNKLPRGLPAAVREPVLSIPAVLPFPPAGSFVLLAPREADKAALGILQQLLLRWLTSAPGGKVRVTFLDPLGLGQNFASFMHLADYDEQLVTSRIWTEPAQIEHRLADLTAHLEHVIQKYLRNQYATIDEYNVQAGEVAEPYRLLVISHFPTNFTVDAARRLASIVQSGPRCGVYTILYVDSGAKLLNELPVAELKRDATVLSWKQGRFVWEDPDFHRLTFLPTPVPEESQTLAILNRIGEEAKANKRVQVPFSFVAPAADVVWQSNSASGLDVPIGRAGATRRQYLRLGQGTSQHALIAGKTGSGKSTLLHALVTNLALCYPPDQAEVYLIDFKKGVEFKTYATHKLPHARVIAIESEREFGLSVLERLLGEMDRRAELYRKAGVQDLKSYRQADPNTWMPRILLIVDEFQEFFIEEDLLADRAASSLDRLVRQGRAFGLHLVLGSQTLGGAYSLARSTIDQMAVRIVLQCSETDGHMILSEENHAARLLSRPGEAIYNDANGLVDGNNPFQVVWLDDAERDRCLDLVSKKAQEKPDAGRLPPLVFEGSAVADITANRNLRGLMQSASPTTSRRGLAVWLGEAIAIKDPTVAYFRPQSGNNLLLLGQNEEAARGLLSAALLSLSAQKRPAGVVADQSALFWLLESSQANTEEGSSVRLQDVAQALGSPVNVLTRQNLAQQMHALREEIEKRQETPGQHGATFLIIHGLQRYRELRSTEDDFSYSRGDGDRPNPNQDLSVILRDGPTVNVHALVWCDTLANLSRQLERASVKEFELRVLFQMSSNDSSVIMDSPKASRLGLYRAIFNNQTEDIEEKFRPYGIPPVEWINGVIGERGA
jgi:S-DNA-T family DNA segregation ATPase FtsK/SpoIIIE